MRSESVKSNQSEDRKRAGAGSNGKIIKKVWIRASADVVYHALTEPKELARWFCDRASCDLREGGEFVAFWKAGKTAQKGRAIITRIVPGAALEMVWVDDGAGEQSAGAHHTLSYEIRTKSGMSELIMTDEDMSSRDSEEHSVIDLGWNSVLLELKDHCERKERSARLRH